MYKDSNMESSQLNTPDTPYTRISTFVTDPPEGTPSFSISGQDKSFKHQYANIYFMRLHALRRFVEQKAKRRWAELDGNPVFVPRVLDVEKSQLSYVIGTVYMDMPLKPNVLDDIARDHSIPSPPPRQKYFSAEDDIMLEDESGRIRLVGDRLKSARLVTGVIIGALGIETNSGDFEVVDICFPGMAPQQSSAPLSAEGGDVSMEADASSTIDQDEWIAIVSGLDVGAPSWADGQLQLLAEYLSGEAGGSEEQLGASRISRLIIAGNSLASLMTETEETEKDRKSRRYGQETSTFSPHPIHNLTAYLTDIARSMPIHLLPGPSDPTGTLLPQQPLPRAMFGGASQYSTFSCETNPTYLHLASGTRGEERCEEESPSTGKPSTSKSKSTPKTNGKTKPSISTSHSSGPSHTSNSLPTYTRTLLVHSGQPLHDLLRYLPSPPVSPLSIAEATLKWRHLAPTAPDTLWCHPFLHHEPFVLTETPDLYIVGNMDKFKTKLVVEDEDGDGSERSEGGRKRCRVVLVPKFSESGVVVLVNLRTLKVRTVCLAVQGMSAGGGEKAL
ncbi:DNA polymerase alpha/epsilon subunit B-domain-containing protein [Irpex rosettiformis]|uniref:DNA polymerase alpha/epsilon subunit B-domain-containing protein n=1 Tax=Irpex rosettiformis TaxID=378272 RepID=A0ACB8TPR5_9APHY|nr:DNA polymerase alpha/epsilon subunit B-domain-containing protein [Irpex rosettiformis]